MKLKYLLIAFLLIMLNTFSQESKKVLFTIDGESFHTKEFLRVYKKNLTLVVDSKNDVDSYLKLFIDYKLKVKEAKGLGLDTLQKFKNELTQYKINLVKPYLRDHKVTQKLVKEAYERLQKEVNVSHILIFVKPDAIPNDTIAAYNKLIEARNLIVGGQDFIEVAKKYSTDPSVEQNGGSVGYFTALQMVYPFENVAYTTAINKVSMPFRTKFGFHILKVNKIRESKGEVEVAHIMFKNESLTSKIKIDSIYKILLTKSQNFADLAKKVSEDRASALKGGKLKKFASGKMIEDFSKVAFFLRDEGDISSPFKTQFGWHIVKLIKKHPIKSFEQRKPKLTQEVEKDNRANLISQSVINRLFQEYNVVVNEVAVQQFYAENWIEDRANFQKIVLSINEKNIFQKSFIAYLRKVANTPVDRAFKAFKEKEVLDYYKDNIESSNSEFAATFKEFKEGLLLFDLLENQVWEKAKDSLGLSKYFKTNKAYKYKSKKLAAIRGTVISDHQNYLDAKFTEELHEKYKVKINRDEKKRIKTLKF